MARKLFVLLFALLFVTGMAFAGGAAEAKGKETLSIWCGYPEMEAFYNHAAAEFQKLHPNVEFNIVTHPLREFEQKLSATIPSNTVADIIDVSVYANQKFIDGGFMPEMPAKVKNFVNAPGRYSEFAIKNNSHQGIVYGVPFFQGRTALFYNTEMFAEAGLSGPPKTLDEMYEYSKKLAKYNAAGNLTRAGHSLRISGQGSGVAEKWWFVLYPMGGTIIEEGKTPGTYHAGYNNDAGRRALKYYVDAVLKDNWDDHRIKHDAEAFQLGQAAMFFRESWVIGDTAAKAPNLKYDTALVPSDARWGRITNIQNLYVTKAAKNPDLAWDFIMFMVNDANQQWLLDNIGWLPARNDVDLDAIIARHPQFEAFIASPEGYEEFGYIPIGPFDELMTRLAERLVTAFMDKSLVDNPNGIAKVISTAAAETNEILKRYNMYGE